jgi:hypothetical protein
MFRRVAIAARGSIRNFAEPNVFGLNPTTNFRHGGARPGHPRLSCFSFQDVDARHKAGHDEQNGEEDKKDR